MDPIKDGLFHIFTLRYPTPTSSPLHPTPPHGEIFELAPRRLVGCIDPSFPIAAPHSLFTNRSRRCGQKLPRRGIASRTTVVVLCIDPALSLVLRLGMKIVYTYGVAPSAMVVQPFAFTTFVSTEFWNMTRDSTLQGRPRYTVPTTLAPDAAVTCHMLEFGQTELICDLGDIQCCGRRRSGKHQLDLLGK